MEKERRKGTWRQVALLLLVAAFLVSGTGIFKSPDSNSIGRGLAKINEIISNRIIYIV